MKTSFIAKTLAFTVTSFALLGCMTAQQHHQQTHGVKERQMTVGTVQREISKGMSGAEVAEVLGSPNIVKAEKFGSMTRFLLK